jgi:hypothetical protein
VQAVRFYETRRLLETYKDKICFLFSLRTDILPIDITTIIALSDYWTPWNWDDFSHSIFISFQDILAHRNLPWKWPCVSHHPNITLDDIRQHMDLPWDWSEVSCNPNMSMEIISENPDLPWDWDSVCKNPAITQENYIWPRDRFYRNDEICKAPVYCTYVLSDRRWIVSTIPLYASFQLNDPVSASVGNMQEVLDGSTHTWCYCTLSRNPHILLRDVEQHSHLPWHWTTVVNTKTDYIRVYRAIRTIQRVWRRYKGK